MGLREFKLPRDAQTIIDVIPSAFQYPEHPEWSLDADEVEDLMEMGKSLKNIWWLIKGVGLLWKPAQDILRGYVWEEDGQPVGLCNVIRQGGSQQWMIGNVAVLPEYRRRGIARKLVESCVDLAIERGAQQIILDVVDGNLPAYELYKSMGFNHYASRLVYEHKNAAISSQVTPLPTQYTTHAMKLKDWRLRYELIKRITPAYVQEYEPINEAKYKVPPILRVIQPIIMRIMKIHAQRVSLNDEHGQTVGTGSYQVHKNGKGTQQISFTLDKTHSTICQPLLERFISEIRQFAPITTIELNIPDWQFCESEIDPRVVGFEQRLTHHRLGMQV